MTQKQQFTMFAQYNADMNANLCQLLAELPTDEMVKNRQAFFGSILGTFNHILVGDLIWLNRFKHHERDFKSLHMLSQFTLPSKLNQLLYDDAQGFHNARKIIDHTIINFITETEQADYNKTLVYKNTEGVVYQKNFGLLLAHLFNHQTHHRGQVSTLFNQLGIDIGVTDILLWID